MKKGITIAGNLIVDIVKNIDRYPSQGMLANISGIKRSIGGCAGNTAMGLSILDETLPITCIGRVGEDEPGMYVLDLLRSKNINTDYIKRSAEPTSFTDVMNSLADGQRTFFHNRGANAQFTYKDIPFDSINSAIFHMGYALLLDGFDRYDEAYGTVMAKTLSRIRSMGIKTSMDVVSEDNDRFQKIVIPSLKHCSYVIMNETEAGLIAGIAPRDASGIILKDNVYKIAEKILSFGVEEYVIIHMPEMGCAMHSSGKYTAIGSYIIPREQIKGTVGAGDAFCAGILYALYHGWEIENALVFANGTAACNLLAEDSVSGIRSKELVQSLAYPIREL